VGTTTTLTTALNVPSGVAADSISYGSFDEIMRQHQKRVYRVILLLVKDRDAADTLTQECFLRAYQKISQFRGECKIETWLIRIAVNLVRDHGKSRRTSFWRRLVGLEAEHANVADRSTPGHSPERVLLARSELQAVWSAVDFLSPQQREVFLLRFVEDLSLAEIAEVLGVRVGSVKAQLFRALGSVRKQMKERQWR
jgi:RNA polymerase sigma-70 factor (ECF subfamily)